MPRAAYRHAVVALTEVVPTFSQRIQRDDVEFVCAAQAARPRRQALPAAVRGCSAQLRPPIVHTRNLAALECQVPAALAGVPVRIHGEHGRDADDLDGTRRALPVAAPRLPALRAPATWRCRATWRGYLRAQGRRAAGSASRRSTTAWTCERFDRAGTRAHRIAGLPLHRPVAVRRRHRRPHADREGPDRCWRGPSCARCSCSRSLRERLRLVMVGDGPLRAEAQAVLDAAGVGDLAWLPGERADVPDVMRGLDCFVLPSLAEGISNTILEAMASGLPVLATAVGGNAELVVARPDRPAGAGRRRRGAGRGAGGAWPATRQRAAAMGRAGRAAGGAALQPAGHGGGLPRLVRPAAGANERTTKIEAEAACAASPASSTPAARGRSTRAVLQRMNDSQLHRGPDEGSLHIEPGLGFGHRRLSHHRHRHRPAAAVQRRRLGGRRLQRRDLQLPGADPRAAGRWATRFHTKSDTEVIVHAWEQWGEDCVKRFRGMFAFALWDRNRQTLFMARDRLGVKPLYYALLDDGTLLFGSELKSLLAHGGLRRDIDPLAVEEYFALGYVAEPRTHLPPGAASCRRRTRCAIRRGQPVAEPKEYWDVHFTLGNPISAEDACAELVAAPARIGAAAPDLRGAAGRLPVRRRRFQRRGGDDGRPVRRAGQHLLDRLRRPAVQRERVRADGGRPLPHQPPRRDRAAATTST